MYVGLHPKTFFDFFDMIGSKHRILKVHQSKLRRQEIHPIISGGRSEFLHLHFRLIKTTIDGIFPLLYC